MSICVVWTPFSGLNFIGFRNERKLYQLCQVTFITLEATRQVEWEHSMSRLEAWSSSASLDWKAAWRHQSHPCLGLPILQPSLGEGSSLAYFACYYYVCTHSSSECMHLHTCREYQDGYKGICHHKCTSGKTYTIQSGGGIRTARLRNYILASAYI